MTAIDISNELLRFSKKRDKSGKMKYACMDCEELAFKEEAFEKIICFGILHHLPNPEKGIEEMHRILRGGGILVSEPNSLSPARRFSEIMWKEESMGLSFYPWDLLTYEYEPEPPIWRRGGCYQ